MARALTDIYWVAGLLEGEGYFGRNGSTIIVRCAMTDLDTIERLAAIIGVGQVFEHGATKGHKPIWDWGIYSKNAAQWMMTLWPLMGTRRRQRISELLEWWATIPLPGYVNRRKTHCVNGHPFDPENIYWHGPKGTKRCCRVCRSQAKRRWHEQRKAVS